jgi:hypothetical protein
MKLGKFRLTLLSVDSLGGWLQSGIDVLKLDLKARIRGDRFVGTSRLLPQQLMIEFHPGMSGYRLSETKKALATLSTVGYRRYYVSETGRELGFPSC